MNTLFPPPEQLVEHRSVMLFVDALEYCDETRARCRATVRPDNPFLTDGRLPNWVMIEYIAQAVAMFAGYRRHTAGVPPRHGLLLGCRRMAFADVVLAVGDRLEIEIEESVRLDDFGRFRGVASRNGERIAEGTLAVVETPDIATPPEAVALAGSQEQ